MPEWIIDLYLIHLGHPKVARRAFERFYNANRSRYFVQCYAVRGKKFYSDFMRKYLEEVRSTVDQNGIITHLGPTRKP